MHPLATEYIFPFVLFPWSFFPVTSPLVCFFVTLGHLFNSIRVASDRKYVTSYQLPFTLSRCTCASIIEYSFLLFPSFAFPFLIPVRLSLPRSPLGPGPVQVLEHTLTIST